MGLAASVSLDADDAPQEPATHDTPESVLLARVEQKAIQNALAELPVNFREIILLCDLEEMSYQEISQTLSIPIGTVMSRLSRARKSMRTLLVAGREGTSL
jgi:RNA polymerase sigma-70 factor (ECF subfamily)